MNSCDKVILAPINDKVNIINTDMLEFIPGNISYMNLFIEMCVLNNIIKIEIELAIKTIEKKHYFFNMTY